MLAPDSVTDEFTTLDEAAEVCRAWNATYTGLRAELTALIRSGTTAVDVPRYYRPVDVKQLRQTLGQLDRAAFTSSRAYHPKAFTLHEALQYTRLAGAVLGEAVGEYPGSGDLLELISVIAAADEVRSARVAARREARSAR